MTGLRALALGALWAACGAAAGCAPDPVALDLNFPSTEAFLFSETVQVRAFAVSSDDLGQCPRIVREAIVGSSAERAAVTLPVQSACEALTGTKVDSVPEGPLAWLAIASDPAGTPLLAGCTVAEVYADAPGIEINLFMTDRYRTAVDLMNGPRCPTVEDKCQRGCQ